MTLDESALGISPWRGDLGVRWQPVPSSAFVEVAGRIVAEQDGVSSTRGEVATPGYETKERLKAFGGSPDSPAARGS